MDVDASSSIYLYIYIYEHSHLITKEESRLQYFEVRRSLSLANEVGTEHRTRPIHMIYHT